ncbi:putative glycolipid-binding domain-containing protein [Actinoplanes sp. NEAU-A12]|uniref:Glycolipid-binding domain-containing protein n=1 Tax=Actinoplanes sandaracinus TaxID=3045177 RepID=A0ABT6WRS0_9ACTN|nr:putative glycolipid-binding domain-containing protein [Actinoplanes sandaracinus]MDI6102436.1 putative glycolipid-binding domain-containing protein [Actinoplanes sandaracinus]
MSETVMARAETRPLRAIPAGPVAWQRTGVIGTELVFPRGGARPGATGGEPPGAERPGAHGTAVVAGGTPYSLQWRAVTDDDAGVQELSVSCRGADWSRTTELRRTDGDWECEGAARIDPDAVVRLADSPIFVTWALRRLGLTVESGPMCVPSVRILTPSLEVVPGTATYHLVSPRRLRITGEGPAVTYELDDAGLVAYQPGNLRLVR